MLITIYTHGLNESQASEICLDIANYKDKKIRGETGEIELAKLLYAIEHFTTPRYTKKIENIGYLFPILKRLTNILEPTFEYWENQKNGV